MQELTDEELLGRYRSQPDSRAGAASLDQLFARYHTRVAVWCYRMTGDRESASDLAQDVFLRAYRNLGSFRGDSRFSTWMYTITRNHCTNEAKSRALRKEELTEPPDLDQHTSSEPDILSTLVRNESVDAVRTIMQRELDATEQRVMHLHFGQEMGLDAVTRLLGLTNASGAKAYVVSAKRKLNLAVQRWNARKGRAKNE